MSKNELIKIISPKPYECVYPKFTIKGYLSESFLNKDPYGPRILYELYDVNGYLFLGGNKELKNFDEDLPKIEGFRAFSWDVHFDDMSRGGIEDSQGLIAIRFHGYENDSKDICLPIKVVRPNRKFTFPNLLFIYKHRRLESTIKRFEREAKEYQQKYSEIIDKYRFNNDGNQNIKVTESSPMNDDSLMSDMGNILEDPKWREIAWLNFKYRESLKRTRPLCTGLAGQLNGFEFRVHSNDHGKHFHVIHKGDGIDARFSFPEITLINYKHSKNFINSRQTKAIKKYFKISKNFKKLENEFVKRDG